MDVFEITDLILTLTLDNGDEAHYAIDFLRHNHLWHCYTVI